MGFPLPERPLHFPLARRRFWPILLLACHNFSANFSHWESWPTLALTRIYVAILFPVIFTILLIFMQLTADLRGERGPHVRQEVGERLAFILNFMPFLLLVVRHVAVVVAVVDVADVADGSRIIGF